MGKVTRGTTMRIDRQRVLDGKRYIGYRVTSVTAQDNKMAGAVQEEEEDGCSCCVMATARGKTSKIAVNRMACRMTPRIRLPGRSFRKIRSTSTTQIPSRRRTGVRVADRSAAPSLSLFASSSVYQKIKKKRT